MIHGDAVKPGGEPCVLAEPPDVPECGQKHFLRRILRFVGIVKHPQRQVVYWLFPSENQLVERTVISVLAGGDPIRFHIMV